MSKGIAKQFKARFGRVKTLLDMKVEVGGVATLMDHHHHHRFIYYLITKKMHYDKPTYNNLRCSLLAMKNHMMENGVDKLAMPKIGCGLDGLDWNEVKNIIHEVFNDANLEIEVFQLNTPPMRNDR